MLNCYFNHVFNMKRKEKEIAEIYFTFFIVVMSRKATTAGKLKDL